MKIISRILSLFFSEMKPDDITMELIFITLVLKAKWVLLIALFNQIITAFDFTHAWAGTRVSYRFTSYHKG